MKILSRDFTRAEKVLIALLALILVGLAYYQFVDKTVRTSIANYEAEAKDLRNELNAAEKRLEALKSVQKNLDTLEAEGRLSWMASYNNSKSEVAFLNDILSDAEQYSVTFATVSRTGDQIRRRFTLQFLAADYRSAQDIVARLCASEDRCLVDDITCTISSKDDSVSIKQTATFYETMVEGVGDAALPSDSTKTKK